MTLREKCREALEKEGWPRDVVLNGLNAIGPLLDAADAEIADLLAANDGAQSMLTQALRERDRAIAEAALLREALETDGGFVMRHQIPLAEAAARVIAAAEEHIDMARAWADEPSQGNAIANTLRALDAVKEREKILIAAVDALRAAREGAK